MESCVLIVDDDRGVAETVEKTLAAPGRSVLKVYQGRSALAFVRILLPDVVILDLSLPDAPGREICRALREDAATRDVPILILTGHRKREEQIDLLDTGADDYVTKPFEPAELKARVAALLRRTSASFRAAAPAARRKGIPGIIGLPA